MHLISSTHYNQAYLGDCLCNYCREEQARFYNEYFGAD